MDLDRILIATGAISAFLGVGLGAFGAHGLRKRLSPDMLAVFDIGVRYQLVHALALLAAGAAASRLSAGALTAAGVLFVVGTVVFSGSLYVLALSGRKWLGAITPLGGLALLAGWASLAWAALGA
ncbi:DUF423 domain-containing protein [Massilia phyllosphaerae]|uniref:DUF423 domain-containing protein n=1 Tax=Massilia phyllosphaerae TaxID=3106034 RepID=UPI002B1CCF27|nr:DUF423 domain-containing protein [Massilia sp. SGZ-792]